MPEIECGAGTLRSTVGSRRSELIQMDGDGTESVQHAHWPSMDATPASPSLAHPNTQDLTVVATDKFGRIKTVTPDCVYTTTNAAVATVDAVGKITTVAAGTCDIKCTLGDIVATVAVTVT